MRDPGANFPSPPVGASCLLGTQSITNRCSNGHPGFICRLWGVWEREASHWEKPERTLLVSSSLPTAAYPVGTLSQIYSESRTEAASQDTPSSSEKDSISWGCPSAEAVPRVTWKRFSGSRMGEELACHIPLPPSFPSMTGKLNSTQRRSLGPQDISAMSPIRC